MERAGAPPTPHCTRARAPLAAASLAPSLLHRQVPGVAAVYWCIVTMSTVGYGDISPSLPETRFFTVVMIFFGGETTRSSLQSPVLCTRPSDKASRPLFGQ